MSFSPGDNVGPYRIIDQLGQGGMATVYRAYHPALDRFVAIKALHPAFMEEPNFLARFQREARVVAKLDHPNIVPIFDFSEHAGQPYLVMKFIEGETLKAILKRGPLPLQNIVMVVRKVGGALSYAHGQGVLHRDIKPSNILITPKEHVYLADFGLARIAEAGQSTLSGDVMLGTPHYISPEQAQGTRELDEGTDIYSMGIVLYELTVGRVPFNADTPFSIIHDHIYSPLPLPRAVNENFPPQIEQVLLKALAKERQDRYGSVNELVTDFLKAVEREQRKDTLAIDQEIRSSSPKRSGQPTAVAALESSSPSRIGEERLQEITGGGDRPWLWVISGILLTLACWITFLIAINWSNPSETIMPDNDRMVMEGESPEGIEADVTFNDLRRTISENPQDPVARMELAQALLKSGNSRLAAAEFIKAGNLFLGREEYLAASEAYLQGIIEGDSSDLEDHRLSGNIAHAAFFAAAFPEFGGFLEELTIHQPDWSMLPVLEARFFLLNGRRDEAKEKLDLLLAQRPGDPFSRAVLVEEQLFEGNGEEARLLGEEIQGDPRAPEWLKGFVAEELAG